MRKENRSAFQKWVDWETKTKNEKKESPSMILVPSHFSKSAGGNTLQLEGGLINDATTHHLFFS